MKTILSLLLCKYLGERSQDAVKMSAKARVGEKIVEQMVCSQAQLVEFPTSRFTKPQNFVFINSKLVLKKKTLKKTILICQVHLHVFLFIFS